MTCSRVRAYTAARRAAWWPRFVTFWAQLGRAVALSSGLGEFLDDSNRLRLREMHRISEYLDAQRRRVRRRYGT